MTLQEWTTRGELKRHRTSRQEIDELLAVADRAFTDCQAEGLTDDGRLIAAYTAAVQLAKVALAAAGYRTSGTGQHYYLIRSLGSTVGIGPNVVSQLDEFRKKRNVAQYERAYAITEKEADAMVTMARQLQTVILEWLRNTHPSLLRP